MKTIIYFILILSSISVLHADESKPIFWTNEKEATIDKQGWELPVALELYYYKRPIGAKDPLYTDSHLREMWFWEKFGGHWITGRMSGKEARGMQSLSFPRRLRALYYFQPNSQDITLTKAVNEYRKKYEELLANKITEEQMTSALEKYILEKQRETKKALIEKGGDNLNLLSLILDDSLDLADDYQSCVKKVRELVRIVRELEAIKKVSQLTESLERHSSFIQECENIR
ncbi:MAG: hypothetical protein HYW47_04435 [Deltaproteobacteria bacterium]|nr:hypothetical protein [Deltaproteobacteria bacterium]